MQNITIKRISERKRRDRGRREVERERREAGKTE